MSRLRRVLHKLTWLTRGRQLDARFKEELECHLAMATEEQTARGLSPDDARNAAIRDLGGLARTKESWREARGFPLLSSIAQDIRYAIRGYSKTPAFTIGALLSLTLAIGANAAIFSLLNALVLRSLPVRDPAQLVQLTAVTPRQPESYFNYAAFRSLAKQQKAFSTLIGWWGPATTRAAIDDVGDGGDVGFDVFWWAATGNIHSELGLTAAAGRLFLPSDMDLDRPSAGLVAVISHAFWLDRFQGSPSAIGRTIRIDGVAFTIIGVTPKSFLGLGVVTQPDVTVPLPVMPLINGHRPSSVLLTRPGASIHIIGRLRAGVSRMQAQANLDTLRLSVLAAAVPATFDRAQREEFLATRFAVTSAANGVEGLYRARYSRPLWILLGIAALVLLIACVNVASLMLSRAVSRSRETGMRLALGASRWRVARQLLIEGLLLSTAGGVLGLIFAFWSSRALSKVIFEEFLVPVYFNGDPDLRVVGVTALAATFVGVLFSLAPMRQIWREHANGIGRGSARAITTSGRATRPLVIVQIAVSLVLLANAGLLIHSLTEIRGIESGISRTGEVLVAYPAPVPHGYDNLDADVYYPKVLQRISDLPGVQSVSSSMLKPATIGDGFQELVAPIGELSVREHGVSSSLTPVSPGFFGTVGISILNGRDFSFRDASHAARVAILSQSLARRLFGATNPIGQRIRIGLTADRQNVEVIGVAADARLYDVKSPHLLAVYVPALQETDALYRCLIIRGKNVGYSALKQAVGLLGREKIGRIVTMRYITDRALLPERLMAAFSGFFGMLALLLVMIGLYGLVSHSVMQRKREIGIRAALGADAGRIMREVVGEGLRISLGGIILGTGAALAATQVVKSLLFGITPHDPLALVGAPLLLVAVAIVASLVPALRAARVDPAEALRAE